jgi:acetyl esterase/lipase
VGKQAGRTPFVGMRLVGGVTHLSLALLAVFPAPNYLLWQAAVAVTEYGYVLAGASLLALLPGWQRSRLGQLSAALGVSAAILALSPLARAVPVAQALPAHLASAFGPAQRPLDPPLRITPLVQPAPQQTPQRLTYVQHASGPLELAYYPPASTSEPAPLVIVIHGGSWQSGDNTQLPALNAHLAQRGYAVAAINYRLAPQHPFPAAAEDVQAAISYLQANATTLGIDPTRIVLLGRSAGAQLALLVAYTSPDPALRGAISFYGPTDMAWGYANPTNPRVLDSRAVLAAYLNGTPTSAPEAYAAASPLLAVDATTPPTLLIHGPRDELVRYAQSERLATQLAAAQRPHFLLRLPWATHGADWHFNGPSGQISTHAIEHFLSVVTKD